MFKGIVMEIKDGYAIVMKGDGTMVRIVNKDGLNVGKSIFFFEEDIYKKNNPSKVIPFRKYIIPLGTVAALFMILIGPVMNMFSSQSSVVNTYALLTFDVNPSIEFKLDEDGVIREAVGINNDGSALGLDIINGMTIEKGTAKLKELLNNSNYLMDNNSLLVGFSFLGKENLSYEDNVQQIIRNTFTGTEVAFLKGNKHDCEEAESRGISLGKYEALVKLNEDNFEDAIENLSTQEMLEMLKNTDGSLFLNEHQIEELQDELEDRIEGEEDNDKDDYDNHDDDEDDSDKHDEDD